MWTDLSWNPRRKLLFFAVVNPVVYIPSGYMCKLKLSKLSCFWQRLINGKDQTVNTVACSQISDYIRGKIQATVEREAF
jgi:hypothetical protein